MSHEDIDTKPNLDSQITLEILEALLKAGCISEILPLPENGFETVYNVSSNSAIHIVAKPESKFDYILRKYP